MVFFAQTLLQSLASESNMERERHLLDSNAQAFVGNFWIEKRVLLAKWTGISRSLRFPKGTESIPIGEAG